MFWPVRLFSKSHVSLGTRNLYFVAIVTIPIPNKPPKIEGNSGPNKIAVTK